MDLDINEYEQYAALEDTIKIEDVTSNIRNQTILQRLKDNDENLGSIQITNITPFARYFDYYYTLEEGEDIGWLGYYIGSNNTKLQTLHLCPNWASHSHIRSLFIGLNRNKTIKTITFQLVDSSDALLLRMLDDFFENNHNLTEFKVSGLLSAEGARQLSLTLGGCSRSLQRIRLADLNGNDIEDGQLVDTITALSVHPQLTELVFGGTSIGRNGFIALANTFLGWSTPKLQKLDLRDCNINDEGLEHLVNALTNVNTLQELYMPYNSSITIRGWKKVATLLEIPCSNLEDLIIFGNNNNIGDEGAFVFANALANNNTLTALDLFYGSGITNEGWAYFSKLLCDTSSVNNTYLSNHTLYFVGNDVYEDDFDDVTDMGHHLVLNEEGQGKGKGKIAMVKRKIAMKKIVHVHSHFDMQPFFEWEFKVLPIMVSWFAKAAACTTDEYEEKIKKMKLSVVYDFIKEFPMLYIEPVTRQELTEYTALEEDLHSGYLAEDEQEVRLEKVRQLKARAMRRLGMK